MQIRSKTILSILTSLWIIMPLYIILHEAGHSLVAILCGATITNFSILGAFMTSEGGVYNTYTSSLMNAAGLLFPLFLTFIYMLCYRKNKDSIFYRTFTYFFCVVTIFSILAWIIIPVIYIFGNAPSNDDVTKFLNTSGIHPVWVTFSSLFLFGSFILFAWHKKIIKNFWYTIQICNEKNNNNPNS